MTSQQMAPACPRCGSADNVHSIQELAQLASSRLNQAQGAQPQAGPARGWEAEPRPGPLPGPGGFGGGLRNTWDTGASAMSGSPLDAFGEDIAGAAMSAAAGLVGRAVLRRVERAMTERVVPAMQAQQQPVLRTMLEIAQRHPDLCGCDTDKVIFLAGGSRVLPVPNMRMVTVEQADQIVAQLRDTVT